MDEKPRDRHLSAVPDLSDDGVVVEPSEADSADLPAAPEAPWGDDEADEPKRALGPGAKE